MITKPLPWAVHLEKENIVPIFSIDVCPRGKCFATGGENGVIKIWNLKKALADENLPDVNNQISLLAEIKTHEKPVNSVRFNKTGKLLASGSSDGTVCVAIYYPNSGTELWKPFRKFFQQKLDVSEVAWGTQEKMKLLGSCSLDSTIVIWDVELGQAVHTISTRHSMVKGLAWDPLGQYLASQTESEGIFVYRTSDWKCIQHISKLFRDSMDSSDHLRLSWSPNGMYLAGVQAYTLPQPYVAILTRDRWTLECCVVGHRSGISVSKWNPRFFQSKTDKKENRLSMCLALGSVDKTFSLWRQTEKQPLLHLDGFFDNRISDIAWSADGYTCLVSSRGGMVALLNFTEEELGKSSDYKLPVTNDLSTSSTMPVAENLNLWMLEQRLGHSSVEKRILPRHEEQPEIKKQRKELTVAERKSYVVEAVKERRQSSLVHDCGSVELMDGTLETVRLNADNNSAGNHSAISCLIGDREIWRDEIDSKAVCLSGNLNFTVVATDACFLRVYDEDGLQLVTSLQLPSQASQLVVDEDWNVLCLTKCGELSLWNVERRKIVCRASVCSLCKTSQLSSIKLSSNSLPIVLLSDRRSFLYNPGLEAWTSMLDSTLLSTGRQSSLSSQRETRQAVMDLGRHVSAYQAKQELELGIMTALDLHSCSDYQRWLMSYVRYLVSKIARKQNGCEEERKLRKICSKLLAGQKAVEGFDHQKFLKDRVLPEIQKVRDLQRLSEEIQDWINTA